jgi:hypothetical protein
MGTLELGNGEPCPFDGCDFILGEDYDGDSFQHIIDKHEFESMDKLFKPVSILQALDTIRLVIQYHKIEGDKMILNAQAIGPIKDVDRFLTRMYNDTKLLQGEKNEEK